MDSQSITYHDIQITSFTNPHLFWFKYLANDAEAMLDLEALEKMLADYVQIQIKSESSADYVPSIGDCVAVCDPKKKKWIRAEIDYIDNDGNVLLWATDYGICRFIRDTDMFLLPEHLEQPIVVDIHMGGITKCLSSQLVCISTCNCVIVSDFFA